MSTLPRGFDWITVLTKLSKDGRISTKRFLKLNGMAGMWPTCACGQLCTQLDREHDGTPKDSRLRDLGVVFSSHVNAKAWCKALATFYRIERRTVRLLKEQGVCIQ